MRTLRVDVLVGMIGSGKSSYAHKRADEGALVISHDGLTEMLHGCYRYEAGLRDCYRTMEQELVRAALYHNRGAVIDRTHLTRESRARWVHILRMEKQTALAMRNTELLIIAVAFPIELPGVHASRRALDDPRGRPYEDWLKVATHHHEQAMTDPLSEDEGFDRIEVGEWRHPREVIHAS